MNKILMIFTLALTVLTITSFKAFANQGSEVNFCDLNESVNYVISKSDDYLALITKELNQEEQVQANVLKSQIANVLEAYKNCK